MPNSPIRAPISSPLGSSRAREQVRSLGKSLTSGRKPLLWACLLATASCANPAYGNPADDAGGRSSSAEATAPASDAGLAPDGRTDTRPPGTSGEGSPSVDGQDAGSSAGGPDGAAPGGPAQGNPNPGVTDAGVAALTPLPLWAMPLIGKYGVQAFAVKQDTFGTTTVSRQLMSVEFVPHEGGLQLRSTTCSSSADNAAALLTLVDPSVFTDVVSDVLLSETDHTWSSTPPNFAFGFTQESPDTCKAKQGQNVSHAPAQSWLSSTCRCALPQEDPTSDDCRVVDPDVDHRPGATYTLRGKTSSIADVNVFAAGVSNTFYTNGKIAADGKVHTADLVAAEKIYQLGCDPAGCADISGLGTYCPASKNHAQFVRLDPSMAPAGGFTCADILSRSATLFAGTPPSLATTCP